MAGNVPGGRGLGRPREAGAHGSHPIPGPAEFTVRCHLESRCCSYFLRNRFLTAGAAASLTGVCSAGVVSLHCALQATETWPSTKEKKR